MIGRDKYEICFMFYILVLVIDKIFGNVSMLINGVFNVKEIVGGL